jgi:hypothetical protein
MIWLDLSVIDDHRSSRFILVHKRLIDDLFLIWSGPTDLLCDFRKVMVEAVEEIGFDWIGYKD